MTEDFVSFDLGMKLKEKGFEWDCYTTFDGVGYTTHFCPTISQVLKWLREEKKIYLELVIVVDCDYMCDIYNIGKRPIECLGSVEYFKTYESAAIAGIEYVLDNLI